MGVEQLRPRPIDEEAMRQFSEFFAPGLLRRHLVDDFADPPIGIMDPTRPEETNFGIDGELIRQLQLRGNETVMDCASGDARFINHLLAMGHFGRILGVDSNEIWSRGGQEAHENFPNVSFFTSDARDLRLPGGAPVPDESFDVVSTQNTLYHIEDYMRALREQYRVLKSGGQIAITTREIDHQAMIWMFHEHDIAPHLKQRIQMFHRQEFPQNQKQRKKLGEPFPISQFLCIPEDSPEGLQAAEAVRQGNFDIIAPEPFYTHFDFAKMDAAGAELFPEGPTDTYRHIGHTPLYENDWDLYSLILLYPYLSYQIEVNGQRKLIRGGGARVLESIDATVKPQFYAQIHEDGFFGEYVRQGFNIYRKAA